MSADLQSVLAAVRKGASRIAPPTDETDDVWGEICVVLTNDAEIAALNKTWRGKDEPTNVLSFPAAPQNDQDNELENFEEDKVLGDVVLAFETIAREAAEQNKAFRNHAAHMVVHGVLHLLGYDHENDKDAGQMESFERKILAALEVADPYEQEGASKSATDVPV